MTAGAPNKTEMQDFQRIDIFFSALFPLQTEQSRSHTVVAQGHLSASGTIVAPVTASVATHFLHPSVRRHSNRHSCCSNKDIHLSRKGEQERGASLSPALFFHIWTFRSGFCAAAAVKWRVPLQSHQSRPQDWNVSHIGGQWVPVSLKDSPITWSVRAVNFRVNPVCCQRGCNCECEVVNVEQRHTVWDAGEKLNNLWKSSLWHIYRCKRGKTQRNTGLLLKDLWEFNLLKRQIKI